MLQAEDGIRELERSRGLGDVYKRQLLKNERTGEMIECAYTISDTQREMILAGGLLNKITAK